MNLPLFRKATNRTVGPGFRLRSIRDTLAAMSIGIVIAQAQTCFGNDAVSIPPAGSSDFQ
jgi:hypothetical protein